MNTLYYMWGFKPDERNTLGNDVLVKNSNYIKHYTVITPVTIQPLLDTVADTFPELAELYTLIPEWVTKTDIGRVLVVYCNGGMYSDADCFIQKPFNRHTEKHNVLLFTEHLCNSVEDLGPRECKNPENVHRIANFCFGSKRAKHPFFKEVLEECIRRLDQLLRIEKKTTFEQSDVLWTCGPDVITTVYHRSKQNYTDVYVYDRTFLRHKCYGSWRNGS